MRSASVLKLEKRINQLEAQVDGLQEMNRLLRQTLRNKGISEPEQPQAQGEPRKGWWCPTCNISPSGNEVTYQEFHQICGTYIGDAEPPSQPRAAVPDEVSELFYRWWFLQIENAEFFNRMQRYLNTEYFYKLAAAPAQPGDAQGGEG